jgi:type IV pilus assembly protein PilW
MKAPGSTRNTGHALLEWLIAMTLAAVISGAAFALYRAHKLSYAAAADAARLRDAAQSALEIVSAQLQMAGFAPPDTALAGVPGLFGCARGRPVGADADPACAPLAGGSDGVLVRYVGDALSTWPTAAGQASDCLGQGVGATALVVNRYYARVSASTGEPELYCDGSGRPGVGQPLVEGVEQLHLRYRLRGVDGWRDAASIAGRWREVMAVEVCVQVRGALGGRSMRYTDCDGRVQAARDTRARLVLRHRVAIRNQEAA